MLALVALLTACCFLTSCGKKKKKESFGLTVIEINLPEEKVTDFIADFRGNIPYEADVRIDGQENQATISPAGATSISMFKKSLNIKINVGGRDYEDQSFRLSAQKTDTTMLKSLIGFAYYNKIGLPVPKVEPVVVYFNGNLWGLYIKIERVTKKFFSKRDMSIDIAYKADNGANFEKKTGIYPDNAFDVRVGNEENYEPIVRITQALHDLGNPRSVELLSEIIDFDSVLKLSAGMALLNHWDSVYNNFHLYRVKHTKAFKALPWDLDATFDLVEHPYAFGNPTTIPGNRLFNYVIESNSTAHFTSLRNWLTSDFNVASLDTIAAPSVAKIRKAFEADPILGGKGLTIDEEYAKLRAGAQSWWNSLDQELTNRGF